MFSRFRAHLPRPDENESRHHAVRPRAGLFLGTAVAAGLVAGAGGVALAVSRPSAAPAPTAAATLVPTAAPTATPPAASPSPTVSPTPEATPPVDPTDSPAPFAPEARRAQTSTTRTTQTVSRNRLIIPALGMNDGIRRTACSGAIPNGVFYWPCAGRNNFYLVGHAWGVFKPVHDAYHRGALEPGMALTYVDGNGNTHRYRLEWVKDLTLATFGQGAVWAATSGPVITLQTCDGTNDSYRIIVRFIPA